MAEFPHLPLFTDAIIADCGHLTDAEFGLYVRILMLMWRSPDCRIPNDEAWIERRLCRGIAVALPVLQEFCQNDGNWWVQKRLKKEFDFVKKYRVQQSDRAKRRWDKEKGLSRGNASALQDPHASGNAPTPTPIEIDKSISLEVEFEGFWKAYPRKVGKAAAKKAFKAALKKTDVETIKRAFVAFNKTCRGKDPQYIPHAATWLNQERWEDEHPAESKPLPIHGGLEFEPIEPLKFGVNV